MPKRTDIECVLVIGSGPIVIGQACEFDYAGTQACKALREDGYRVVLLNSNPATIMTDPEIAHRTYVEPMTIGSLEQILERERPDAILPTMGGQTALNLAVEMASRGLLDKYGVELIGARLPAIEMAEDRERFRAAMNELGLRVPKSLSASTLEEAQRVLPEIGLPAIIRPSFTLGGTGGGIAYHPEQYGPMVQRALQQSPLHKCLIEQSVIGWKEYEFEVMRDSADNVVIVCSIENIDPMGVHTGDSVTVAPAQTLTDKEHQAMRDAALAIIRKIGVDTGGANIQFGVDPTSGEMVVVEMNPRVSRSSALASKATGFPIAKLAAKLAVGYTLDELRNDITRQTPACFEPAIDYVVTKVPRFHFEKFPGADSRLTTQMKSVGEAMAIGRTFKESFQKAMRSLESGQTGLASAAGEEQAALWEQVESARPSRLLAIAELLRTKASVDELYRRSRIDPWFLNQIAEIVEMEGNIGAARSAEEREAWLRPAKQAGLSDRRLAELWSVEEAEVRSLRYRCGVRPVYKRVDTCAAEFEAHTPYLYASYEQECEARPSKQRKVLVLGSGPNRIGQGIEFDYCCVHAVAALRAAGFETIMVNCNPGTVSTDFDVSDRLYFEPLTLEDVLEIVHVEKPVGVMVQFGGQTPLLLAAELEAEGVTILGTSPDAIDRAEDRERFDALLEKIGARRPAGGMADDREDALCVASRVGYPVLVRPSYVLGGRAMQLVSSPEDLDRYMLAMAHSAPVLVDHFLADAIEVDVDAISDGTQVVIGGIMEHVEPAGVHSGDSACSLPPYSLSQEALDEMVCWTRRIALELGVVGLINVQYAVKDGLVYVIEANPRASRTVPFVSKAIGRPLAKLAALVMMGVSLEELRFTAEIRPRHVSVKEAVFPFGRFAADILLGPEMRSTGEVMGIGSDFASAYGKSQIEAGNKLPTSGCVLVSAGRGDETHMGKVVRGLAACGLQAAALPETAAYLSNLGIEVRTLAVDDIDTCSVDLVIDTSPAPSPLRLAALERGISYITTVRAACAAVSAIRARLARPSDVLSLQEAQATAEPRIEVAEAIELKQPQSCAADAR